MAITPGEAAGTNISAGPFPLACTESTASRSSDSSRCWGNYESPHHLDVDLADIVDIVLRARPRGLALEAANARHAHEWKVLEQTPLPNDKVLIPGVIDTCSNVGGADLQRQEARAHRAGAVARGFLAAVAPGHLMQAASSAHGIGPQKWRRIQHRRAPLLAELVRAVAVEPFAGLLPGKALLLAELIILLQPGSTRAETITSCCEEATSS